MGLFRSLFGPGQEEIWTSLRAQIDAELVDGGMWRGDRLRMQAGDWTVTLDEYTQMVHTGKTSIPIAHTRMRAPFPNPTEFRFSIYRASVFSYLGTLMGMQDIEAGYPEFDKDFVIKSNRESDVRSLCGSAKLRALVTAQPKFQLSIQDDEGWFGTKYPPSVDVLVFDVAEKIRDVERLKGLYDVFAETLNKLSKMGIAGSGTGDVTI
ncbi:MAG: DUF3137 domain-containing protein [Pseudomonadota bacterium]